MALVIPIEAVPVHRFRTTLEGLSVAIMYRWQTWSRQWYIDVDCDDAGVHSHGLALVTDRDILANRSVGKLGMLTLVDLQGTDDPDYDGLGVRWVLLYVTRDELDAIT